MPKDSRIINHFSESQLAKKTSTTPFYVWQVDFFGDKTDDHFFDYPPNP
jgi:hypothetical protein